MNIYELREKKRSLKLCIFLSLNFTFGESSLVKLSLFSRIPFKSVPVLDHIG